MVNTGILANTPKAVTRAASRRNSAYVLQNPKTGISYISLSFYFKESILSHCLWTFHWSSPHWTVGALPSRLTSSYGSAVSHDV